MSEKILMSTGPSARGAHRLQNALTCPALYAFQNLLRHEAATGDRGPLVRGSIGHAALAHHYARLGAVQQGLDPERYYTPEEAIVLVADSLGDMGRSFIPLIQNAYKDYTARYMTDKRLVHMVEYLVETMVGPHRFTQRWDLVLRDSAGKAWITDHKFVAKPDHRTIERYTLSIQFLGMAYLGSKHFGSDFGGVVLNLVGVGSTPTKFVRTALPPAPFALSRFPEAVAHAEKIIAEVEALKDPWKAPGVYSEMVCMTPYGPCPAMELCQWGPGHLTMDGRRF